MTEEQIFLAALDLPESAPQSAYLATTCGADTELRGRVEELLAAHFKSGEFLNEPVGQQLGTRPASATIAETVYVSGNPEKDAMSNGGKPAEECDDLRFLEPSTRADSLGRIGHYEVLQVLGKGGFGIVFRAFDDVLQRVVALIVLAPPIAATSPARKRFLREAQASARVRHENVVQVHAVEELPIPYLVMEFIAGETLQQRLDRKGPLTAAEIVTLGGQIAEGLAAAHATGLIHRDIKPGNILIEGGSNDRVKITDFGLARAADDASMTQSGMLAGTPMYMAPEQAQGDTLDQRADLFSLGSVMYVMAAGRPPFRAATTFAVLKRVVEETPRPISDLIPETPQWLCNIIGKLHAKKPDDRFQSAREVADVLADCEAQLKEHSRVRNLSLIQRRQSQPTGHRKALAVATAIFLLLLIALAVTEATGLTHLFLGRQVVNDPMKPSDGPAPGKVAQQQPPPIYKNSIGMEFVIVPKGKSWLGGSNGKTGDTEVEFKEDFYLGKYEVTQEEWEQVMGENPSHFSRDGDGLVAVKNVNDADLKRFPVENVTWDQCQLFVNKLNKLENQKQSGWVYRLPKETEWEYACRGGPMSNQADSAFDYYFAKPTNTLLPKQANFKPHGLGRTCKVGSFEPNVLGLYDMHGNVEEWCDEYGFLIDGNIPIGAAIRGGNYDDGTAINPSVVRHQPPQMRNNLGFRLARLPFGTLEPEVKTQPVIAQEPLKPTFKNSIGMEFVRVLMGKSWLGGGQDKLGDQEVEMPADYYLGKFEVTQEEWEKVMGENPSHFSRTGEGKDAVKDISDADLKRFPVETVSWDHCQLFVAKLNKLEKEPGWVYRLPKMAEWEYACRGGPMADKADSAFDYYFTEPTNALLLERANFNTGTQTDVVGLLRTCKVGSYESNKLGLFDMHGNVTEWCEDRVKEADQSMGGVHRGGAWNFPRAICPAKISWTHPTPGRNYMIGLRLARAPADNPSRAVGGEREK